MANIRGRLVAALQWTRGTLTPSGAAWSGAANALFALWAILFVAFGAIEAGPHFSLEKLVGLIGLFAFFAVISVVLLLVIWAGSLLTPRYRFALLLSFPVVFLYGFFTWMQLGAFVITPLTLIGVSLFFGAAASWFAQKKAAASTLVFLGLGSVTFALALYGFFKPVVDPNPALAGYHLTGHTLALPDPGKPGPYDISTFTYGSGKDAHRPEYGAGVHLVSRSVDGSKLDTQWAGFGGWLRTRYWGFGPKAFPVQGRVWMPKGKGPFPLVLIVHGNHAMEDFSDPGYAYLGTLLASQGFILVSVDENFLNSSLADYADIFHIRWGSENRVRGWLLLEHLVQWRAWNADPHNPLSGKVDMDRIGLIGHSRGGEAVAIANAFNALGHYPDDATLPFNYHFKLGAIAAIAPVDGQYSPRDRPMPMHDTNYFVIQGSLDGDLLSFMGSSQYSRETFSPDSKAFKATLYVKDANHDQFNTVWGRNDVSMPVKPFLDERAIMDGDAQRRIAKVYLSAFLQMALNGKTGYRPLFEDARNGAGWLPDAYLMNDYADADTRWLANYEEDIDPATGSAPGVTITAQNLSVWREDYVSLKFSTLDSHVAVLAWDDRFAKPHASYRIDLGEKPPQAAGDTNLVFSLSSAAISTLPANFHPAKADGNDKTETALDWTVVLTDAHGVEARLPLSHDQPLYPQVKANTRRIAELSSIPAEEIVMRRYRFPLRDFASANPRLDLAQLKAIRFDFDRTKRGAIVLDDVGLAPH
ncbi:MAG TPA: hypothetical protein VGG10_02240 [Rhizomicrobium sp.]|jgi:dienelactone hydrolase